LAARALHAHGEVPTVGATLAVARAPIGRAAAGVQITVYSVQITVYKWMWFFAGAKSFHYLYIVHCTLYTAKSNI